jgi:hypothetical protein
MAAPFLSYHAAMAGLANMAAAISPTETSLLICASPYDISDGTVDSGPVRVNWTKGRQLFFVFFISSALGPFPDLDGRSRDVRFNPRSRHRPRDRSDH